MYAQIIPDSQSAFILISIDFCKLSIHYNFHSSCFHRLVETKNTLLFLLISLFIKIIFPHNLLNDYTSTNPRPTLNKISLNLNITITIFIDSPNAKGGSSSTRSIVTFVLRNHRQYHPGAD